MATTIVIPRAWVGLSVDLARRYTRRELGRELEDVLGVPTEEIERWSRDGLDDPAVARKLRELGLEDHRTRGPHPLCPSLSLPELERAADLAGSLFRLAHHMGICVAQVRRCIRGERLPTPREAAMLRDLLEGRVALADSSATAEAKELRELVHRAGGCRVVSRALGLAHLTVRNWSLGYTTPRPDLRARLEALPVVEGRRGGRPRTRTAIVAREDIEGLVNTYGNLNTVARVLDVSPIVLKRIQLDGLAQPAVAQNIERLLAEGPSACAARTPMPSRDNYPMDVAELQAAVDRLGGANRTARLLGISSRAVKSHLAGRSKLWPKTCGRLRELLWTPEVSEPPPSPWVELVDRAGGDRVVARAIGVAEGTVWNWRKGMSSPTPEHAAKLRALPAKAKRGQVRDITEEELAPLCRLLEKQGNNGAATARVAGLRPAAVWRIVLNLRATPEELAKIAAAEKRT